MIALLFEEALVVPHHQLAVDLLHRFERDPDGDEQGRPAEWELRDTPELEDEEWDERDDHQEQRSRQRDPVQDPRQVALGRWSGPDTGDEPALLPDDVGLL